MASSQARLPQNAPGAFWVDDSCIDCGCCRVLAPHAFGDLPDAAFVYRQPDLPAEVADAARAAVSCPVGAIGADGVDLRSAAASLPVEVLPGIYHCGFASRSTYGASSWLVRRPGGNVLIDVPRPLPALFDRIAALGGVRRLFLTHRDDVDGHAAVAARFGAERLLHRADQDARTREVETLFDGDAPFDLAPDLRVIPVPGHTRGSAALRWRDVLFTGDHLWGRADGSLGAGRSVCWWSWAEQAASMERLRDEPFAHVLPGHGRPWHGGAASRTAAIDALVHRMRHGGGRVGPGWAG